MKNEVLKNYWLNSLGKKVTMSKGLSRRSFLRGSMVAAAAVVVSGVPGIAK
jgi:hypothetical protein